MLILTIETIIILENHSHKNTENNFHCPFEKSNKLCSTRQTILLTQYATQIG